VVVPDRHPLLNSLAILYVAKGRFDDGLRVLNEAIRLRPDDAATWVNLGVCLEAKKDLRGAIAAYTQALTITRPWLAHPRISIDLRKWQLSRV